MWDAAAKPKDKPLIIFNGELDRLRGGYYPGRGLCSVPTASEAYLYIHGALFIHLMSVDVML